MAEPEHTFNRAYEMAAAATAKLHQPPTHFYTICFSLGPAESNMYPYLAMLQLRALQKTRCLKEGDDYSIVCDAATAEVFKKMPMLSGVRLLVVPTPPALKEGMMLKYIFPSLVNLEDHVAVYLDLDILPIKQTEFNVPPDTLATLPEGKATDSNYCGTRPLDLPHGLSAGFFVYRFGPRVKTLFRQILLAVETSKEQHYTLDQPHFNHAIAVQRATVGYMPPQCVSYNGHGSGPHTHFINLCGDPGDGPLHFRKALEIFIRVFS